MKRLLFTLTLLFLVLAGNVYAQHYRYTQLRAVTKGLSRYKYNITLDVGKTGHDNISKDSIARFDTLTDAINYMDRQGWEYMNAVSDRSSDRLLLFFRHREKE